MISVAEAEKIIGAQLGNWGTEEVSLEQCLGRVLANDIKADRDLPPYDRVTMDGVAIKYEALQKGIKDFQLIGTQAAGDDPIEITNERECVEIMTGASLPASTDTIVRYEDITIADGKVHINIDEIRQGQNVHYKGTDKRQDEIVAYANQFITPAMISVAASVGAVNVRVKKLPKVVIISTGNELVDIDAIPSPYEVRRSNDYTVKAVLEQYKIQAEVLHLEDDYSVLEQELNRCITAYDVILLSGAVSMGKYDHLPKVLEALSVKKLFHKVQQRPGKPFWFGVHDNGVKVFAFPGNPVSTFMCLHRYFLPWLERSLGIEQEHLSAILNEEVTFMPALQYFLQVKLSVKNGQFLAMPVEGHGSGDFANLVHANAFMELPLERSNFKQGEIFRIWPFKQPLSNF